MWRRSAVTPRYYEESMMQTIQVKPKQTVQIKVKPCVKLASLALFDKALLTIYNQAKEDYKNGKIRN